MVIDVRGMGVQDHRLISLGRFNGVAVVCKDGIKIEAKSLGISIGFVHSLIWYK